MKANKQKAIEIMTLLRSKYPDSIIKVIELMWDENYESLDILDKHFDIMNKSLDLAKM